MRFAPPAGERIPPSVKSTFSRCNALNSGIAPAKNLFKR